ncbi:heterokaryon incompatibility protein-domain-containing protein [Cercophora newfieldiana]|uniref:Heterokaryon incompatibility protein-domain-containing protein n=1 Tax=Cercophora newfieldiana TaxID=92897 RepID=A0AA40CJR5_9PEZI|nr:heterokaryon incompatibility protein-domain-containing protein [Cercophora newfieldiana]
MTKSHRVSRSDIIQAYEHCPRRPYVELTVPHDAFAVTSAAFTTESRDQGWAGDTSVSFTWFEVALRRPEGRSDVADIKIHHNAVAVDEFGRATTRWDARDTNTPPRVKSWLRTAQPGDVIQLIPKAQFPCWVNIIREGTIDLEYEPTASHQGLAGLPSQPSQAFRDTHNYKPLDYAAQQIRVLAIQPGAYEADILAHFEYINLANPGVEQPSFHALSYYWGDSSEKVFISILDGNESSKIGISGTLERAIRRLRSSTTAAPLRIWIDAICINQDDLEERAHQVAMMGSIYSRAEMVHVWLDDYVLGLDEALRLIRDIVNINKRCCPGGSQCRCSGSKHTLSAEQLDEITQSTEWHSFGYTREVFFQHRVGSNFSAAATDAGSGGGTDDIHFTYFMQTFFHHPWFQRVWVIQEAILSPKTVVYSAKEEVPWEELLMINEMASTPEYAGEARWSVQTRDSMPAIWNALAKSHGKRPLPILEVYLKALDLKATNPCDKLWALLSFGHETKEAAKIPALLRPDYNKPVNEVMADFTRWWILGYQSLDILSFIHCQPTRAWRRTLCDADTRVSAPVMSGHPTWALATDGYAQWSPMTLREQFPSAFAHIALLNETTPDLGLIRPSLDIDTKSNPLELSLRGKTLGTIVSLGHPPREMVSPAPPEEHKTIAAVFNRLFDPSARMGVWLLRGVNYHEEHWDPQVLEGILNGHTQAHFSYVVDPEAKQHVLVPGAVDGSSEYECYESYDLPACLERCFFVLDGPGMYGLCPWTARGGDVVVLLHGARVPYILRPAGEEGRYQLVGECFVEMGDGLDMGMDVSKDGKIGSSEVFVLV